MKKILYYISAGFLSVLLPSCSDWVKPEARNYEPVGVEGSDKGDEYYAELRAWKEAGRVVDSDGKPARPVTFGWFSDWTGVGTNMSNQLMGLPDSVDFVSMWGNWHSLSPEKKEDLRKVREIKGTKVLMCFIIDNIGAQTTPQEVEQNLTVDGVKYNTREEALAAFWGWYEAKGITYGTSSMDEAIRKYARSILDTIRVYDWDGFDLDLEPHYGSPGNIASYPDRLSILLDEFSKELGPKSGTGKMLCVDGEPAFLNAEDGRLLDYFIIQAYNDTYNAATDSRLDDLIQTYEGVFSAETVVGKTILCSNFESYGDIGGPTYYMNDGTQTFQLNAFAQYRYPGVDSKIGGIGAYRMVFDKNYEHYREAMRTLHAAPEPEVEQ